MDPSLSARMEELRENTEIVFSRAVTRPTRPRWPESLNSVTNQNVHDAFAPEQTPARPPKWSGSRGFPEAHLEYASNAMPQDTRYATSSSTAPYNMNMEEKMAFREDFRRMSIRWSRVQSQWVPGQFDPFRDDLDTIVPPKSNPPSPAPSKSTLVDERLTTPAVPYWEELGDSDKGPDGWVPIPPPEWTPQYRGCWCGCEIMNRRFDPRYGDMK